MNLGIPGNPNEAHTAGRFAMREDIRRIMRDGLDNDTSYGAADLMREVVQWASTHPIHYQLVLAFRPPAPFPPRGGISHAPEDTTPRLEHMPDQARGRAVRGAAICSTVHQDG